MIGAFDWASASWMLLGIWSFVTAVFALALVWAAHEDRKRRRASRRTA